MAARLGQRLVPLVRMGAPHGSAHKYRIHDRAFRWKKDACAFVREQLRECYRDGRLGRAKGYTVRVDRASYCHAVLQATFKLHYDYEARSKGGQECDFVISRGCGGGMDVAALLPDGERATFSWVDCASFNSKPAPFQKRLDEALRTAVVGQTAAFYERSEKRCARCAREDLPLETDHADPEFREIKRMFLEGGPVQEGGVSFARCASNNGMRFAPEEAALDAEWRRFHQQHAALQLLCVECHAKKSAAARAKS